MIALLLSITAIASDGVHVYVARPGGVDVYREGKKVGTLGSESRVVMGLAARNGWIAECGGVASEHGAVRMWKNGKPVWTAKVHGDLVYRVAWSADGSVLYTAGGDKKIGVLDPKTGKVLRFLEGHTGPVLALAVKEGILVSGGADRTIRVWKDEKPVRSINNHWDAVNALAWSPDGRYLVSGSSDRTVRVWQPVRGRLVRIIREHEGAVLDVIWTEKHIVSACSDGKVRLIAADDVTILKELEGHGDWVNALCFAVGRLHSGAASGEFRSW